jgi:hypothetical protein
MNMSIPSNVDPPIGQGNQANGSKDESPLWKKIAEICIAAATVGLLFVTGAYTVVSYCQWQTAKNTLVASQRPWVAFDVQITRSLVIDSNGANIGTGINLENVGNSPAVRLAVWPKFYPYTLNNLDAASERIKVCGQAPTNPTITDTLFQGPSRKIPKDWVLEISKDELDARIRSRPFTPTIMVCVVYRTTFNDELHHTVKIFQVMPTNQGEFIPLKVGDTRNFPPETLLLVPYPYVATDAN